MSELTKQLRDRANTMEQNLDSRLHRESAGVILKLEDENARLRKEIEEAPHNILCPIWVNGYKANLIEWEDDCGDKYVCNCWKSKAMKEEK